MTSPTGPSGSPSGPSSSPSGPVAETPLADVGRSSRRSMLRLGGLATAASLAAPLSLGAAPSASAASAPASPLPRTRPYSQTPVPQALELHLMNRMGCGFTPALAAVVRKAGGAYPWFEQQLNPARLTESSTALAAPTWFPDLDDAPARMWQGQIEHRKGGWEYGRDLANLTMLRRMYSNKTVLETVVDFWSNHLHVPVSDDLAWLHRHSYDQMLRRRALGRFDDLLVEATLHPAMQLYLDNWRSTRAAPNENHGRELLELHTVGRDAGYSEAMVKDSAKILSGYTIDAWASWEQRYDTGRHATGQVQVLGFSHANASSDGRAVTEAYLRYLAHHPATAKRIASALARRFVSDTPSGALIAHLASVFRSSGTDVRATLRALVRHPEFAASAGAKVRTPVDDLVATVRVLGVRAQKPTGPSSFAHELVWAHRGPGLYAWPRPDGSPEVNSAWTSAGGLLGSFTMHFNLAGQWWPSGQAVFRPHASWLPQRSLRFDAYVDHLCRSLLGRPSTPRLLASACQASGVRTSDVVDGHHPVTSWLAVRVLAALLDTPTHLTR